MSAGVTKDRNDIAALPMQRVTPSGHAPVPHAGSRLMERLLVWEELLTLVDEQPHEEYDGTRNVVRMIDQPAFPKTPGEPFWTSSRQANQDQYATVSFADGMTSYADPTALKRVRCVTALP